MHTSTLYIYTYISNTTLTALLFIVADLKSLRSYEQSVAPEVSSQCHEVY